MNTQLWTLKKNTGQRDKRTKVQKDKWKKGQMDKTTKELKGKREKKQTY